jgi:putative phosphoesterase
MERRIIGVISDTHGLIREEALEALKESELIVHAGDIGNPQVIERLRSIAPVVAVRGNMDNGQWVECLPKYEIVQAAQTCLYVIHDLNDLDLDPLAAGFSAVIYGHSHRPSIQLRKGVLLINPGSAGPRRFDLPISVALICLEDGKLEPRLIELAIAKGPRNK